MIISKIPFRLFVCGILFVGLICPANSEGSNDTFEKFMEIIRNGNAYQRVNAIPSLGHLDHPEVVPVLVDLLKDENSQVRTYAAQQLNRLSDKRSTEAIVAALRDDNENVREYAAQTLLQIGASEHVPALVEGVINNLPDPADPRHDRSVQAMLKTIGKLSKNAPAKIIDLLEGIKGEKDVHKYMWWFYEEVAICLEGTGDKDAYSELKRVDKILSNGKQDYKTWYAFRKALGSIAPKTDSFNRPAADILYSIRSFKITPEGIRKRWILPLAELGEGAIDDLVWAITFEGEQDFERKNIAIQALGEIGGEKAAKVLREYIHSIMSKLTDSSVDTPTVRSRPAEPSTDIPVPPMPTMDGIERHQRRLSSRDSYSFRLALPSLLKAELSSETVEEIIDLLPILDMDQDHVLYDISKAPAEKIPTNIKILFYKKILMEPPREGYMGPNAYNVYKTAQLLKNIGGKGAGDALAEALIYSKNPMARDAAAIVMGNIKDYDGLPMLIKAAKERKASVASLAEAMGNSNDPRALASLEDMEDRTNLGEMDRLWLAAALAKFGKDYEKNAEIVREGLPASYEPMRFLNDGKTINILINTIQSGPNHGQAIQILEAIGSREALAALGKLLEQDKISNTQRYREIAAVSARIAERLNVDSRSYYADVATVSKAVLDWFEIHQRAQPRPKDRSSFKVVERHGDLARKLWIAEATRRLDLAVKEGKESHEYNIPVQAIMAIVPLYNSELIPALERIAKESKSTVSFYEKNKVVHFYNIRSKVAETLTEKTGQQYFFINVDGRKRPGGWHPFQE